MREYVKDYAVVFLIIGAYLYGFVCFGVKPNLCVSVVVETKRNPMFTTYSFVKVVPIFVKVCFIVSKISADNILNPFFELFKIFLCCHNHSYWFGRR